MRKFLSFVFAAMLAAMSFTPAQAYERIFPPKKPFDSIWVEDYSRFYRDNICPQLQGTQGAICTLQDSLVRQAFPTKPPSFIIMKTDEQGVPYIPLSQAVYLHQQGKLPPADKIEIILNNHKVITFNGTDKVYPGDLGPFGLMFEEARDITLIPVLTETAYKLCDVFWPMNVYTFNRADPRSYFYGPTCTMKTDQGSQRRLYASYDGQWYLDIFRFNLKSLPMEIYCNDEDPRHGCEGQTPIETGGNPGIPRPLYTPPPQ